MNAAGLSTTGSRSSAASCSQPISSASSSVCRTSTSRPSSAPSPRTRPRCRPAWLPVDLRLARAELAEVRAVEHSTVVTRSAHLRVGGLERAPGRVGQDDRPGRARRARRTASLAARLLVDRIADAQLRPRIGAVRDRQADRASDERCRSRRRRVQPPGKPAERAPRSTCRSRPRRRAAIGSPRPARSRGRACARS